MVDRLLTSTDCKHTAQGYKRQHSHLHKKAKHVHAVRHQQAVYRTGCQQAQQIQAQTCHNLQRQVTAL